MKHVFTFFLLTSLFVSPLAAFAQATPENLSNEDLQRINTEISNSQYVYCESDDNASQETKGWRDGLHLQNQDASKNAFQRYTVQFGSRKLSLALPYLNEWSVKGKHLQPYLIQGTNQIGVGPLTFVEQGVQDPLCSLQRKYLITLTKGTVKSQDAAFRKQFKKDSVGMNAVSELPTVWLTLGGKNAAIIPTAEDNSGSIGMYYQGISVDLAGGLILTIKDPSAPSFSTVNLEMLRIAASVR